MVNRLKENIDVVKLGINVRKLKSQTNGNVVVDIEKESDKIKLTKEIQKQFGDTCEVTNVTKKLPRLKIVNMQEDILNLSDEDIIDKITMQNDWIKTNDEELTKNSIKLVKKYVTRHKYASIILQTTPKIYGQIMSRGKLRFGWSNLRVFNHINMIRCFKCWKFDHISSNCVKNQICRICSENHHESECKSEVQKCINCIKSVSKFK